VNVFNRIVVVLLILVLMIVIPLALIFPEQAQATLRAGADIIQLNVAWLNGLPAQNEMAVRAGLSVAGLIIFLIGILLLILEVVRFRRRTVRLRDGSGELTTNGIGEHLGYYIDMLPDVVRVQPAIRSKGKSVSATLYAETAPGINVPEKSNQIRETARYVLEEQLGLHVRDEIRVVIRPASFPSTGAVEQVPPIIAEARRQREAGMAPSEATEAGGTEQANETQEIAEEQAVAATEEEPTSAQEGEDETFEFKAPPAGEASGE
jgi:hypothetical protein